jgi:HIRAN domain
MDVNACWHEDGEWRGFVLMDSKSDLSARHAFETWIAGLRFQPDAQSADFSPGAPLQVVPEPDNPKDPNALAVWNADATLFVGYIPSFIAEELQLRPVQREALALSEVRNGGRRIHIGILVSRETVNLNLVPDSPATEKPISLAIARSRKQIRRQRESSARPP